MVRALAIDVGTSSVRTAVVDADGVVSHTYRRPLSIRTSYPGEVELDADEITRLTLELAARTLHDQSCDVVGVTNQRATTIVFDSRTGRAVGPALGWQDLRTVLDCLILQAEGLRLAPNQSATKAKWLVEHSGLEARHLRFATIETWITRHLTGGALHVTDRSNAGVTGLVDVEVNQWDERSLSVLGLDHAMMPRIVDTMGIVGAATALAGSPMITALVGDQSASLFGQSCVTEGAKITFGTGAMLDMVRGPRGPRSMTRFDSGCFPVVVRSQANVVTWGIEGIVFSAGACIDWLRDNLAIIESANETESIAESVASSDGVAFVPALSGLGTPQWDFGARGGFFGITRGTTRAHMVRAVLEGIAQRGADLIGAAERETRRRLEEIRVDGGMSVNGFLLQSLANFSGLRVEASAEREATTRGAGLMALVGAGHLSLDDIERLWRPARIYEPMIGEDERLAARQAWFDVVHRVERTIPELSAVEF